MGCVMVYPGNNFHCHVQVSLIFNHSSRQVSCGEFDGSARIESEARE